MKKLEEMDNKDLLYHFKSAICDNNYNPGYEPYNTSGYTLDELEEEIIKRMK